MGSRTYSKGLFEGAPMALALCIVAVLCRSHWSPKSVAPPAPPPCALIFAVDGAVRLLAWPVQGAGLHSAARQGAGAGAEHCLIDHRTK